MKKKLVKWTHFCLFQRIFKIFQNFKNQKHQTYCKWTFRGTTSITLIILARKISFLVFFGPSYFGVQKTPKMRFYEQVWSVWCLWYPEKFICNKFDVSDFWNFEKILKVRLKRQKHVHFTKMLLSLRRNKTSSVKLTQATGYPHWKSCLIESFLNQSL